jgi:predicted transcriptional regulator
MSATLSIRLDRTTQKMLSQVCRRDRRRKSEIVRDALRRQLSIQLFERLRREIMPFAEARGYLTDEDVFREVS